jgi:hypothetical protein
VDDRPEDDVIAQVLVPALRAWTSTVLAALGEMLTASLTIPPTVMDAGVDAKPAMLVVVARPDAFTVRIGEIAAFARAVAATTRRNCHVPAAGGARYAVKEPCVVVLSVYAEVNRVVPARRYCTETVRVAFGATATASAS